MFKKMLVCALVGASMPSAYAGKVQIDVDFGNQEVTVSTNGMEVTVQNKKLYRKRVQMVPGRIAIGSQVITNGLAVGKIVAMNRSTRMITVQANYDGSLLQKSISQLATTEGCNGALCVGEPVITNGLAVGRVAGFFGDGTIVVRADYDGSLLLKSEEQVALTDVCDGMFCTGDKVITNGNTVGRIAAMLPDGTIIVRADYDGSLLKKAPEQLSVTSAVCANIYINRLTSCR